MPENRARGRTAGFTLVELAVVSTVLFLVLGSIAIVVGTSQSLYEVETIGSHLEGQAALAARQVVRELRIAGTDTLDPDPIGVGTSSMDYRQAIGVEGGVVTWTTPRRIELRYETGEVDDGADNNGNGLIDEGQVVLTTDVGGHEERSRVVTRWVAEYLEGESANGLDDNGNGLIDEPGFVLERSGEALVLRLTIHRRADGGRLLTRTVRTSIRPRNRLEPLEE